MVRACASSSRTCAVSAADSAAEALGIAWSASRLRVKTSSNCVCKSGELRAIAALDRALISRLIEKDRRLLELIEEKDHHAEEQDEKLHRHFHDGVEEQADAAGAQRTAREIALHLRLIGAEIGEREEKIRPECRTRRCSAVDGSIEKSTASSFPILPAMESASLKDKSAGSR